ncbi:helix-turn-helix domain containing protein [Nocardia exalbida]|uniref:helix-turn-helix domain containing protein n=1 Tax=Nocardia exalbida TaxID=290231 RepID=UPI0002F8E3E3|nr:helix-turn-helix domain containing protein [Nocardia exalbida]
MPDEPSNGSSEIAALAQQVETARGKLPLQLDPALLEVLSEREITAERELAEWIRAQRRKQRRREIEAELAAEQRDRKSAAALRRSEEADDRWHRRALAARRRASSEDARLAQLYRRAEWSSRALISVVVLGMVWAGVNVQHNLVPSGDMSDPLYWLSYGIEAMISIPIITIMVAATTAARWGRELARGKVLFFEAALLGTTVALNTGPHLAAGDLGRAAEYAIAPVMVGVVIWLHAWVAARYAVLIDGAPVIEGDRRMIRLDAQPGMPEADGYHSLDGAATSRPGSETYAHRPIPGVSAGMRRDTQDESTRPTTVPGASDADHAFLAAVSREDGDEEVASDEASGSTDTHYTNGHAVLSLTNGHTRIASVDGRPLGRSSVDHAQFAAANPENGETRESYSTSGPADERSTSGHTVGFRPNGTTLPQAPNGLPVETTVNGHDLSLNGRSIRRVDCETPVDGTAHLPQINGHTVRPATNGHTADGSAHSPQINGHTVHPNTNSHTAAPPDDGNAHPPQINGHTLHPTTNSHTVGFPATTGQAAPEQAPSTPKANGRNVERPGDSNAHPPQINGYTVRPAADIAAAPANDNAHSPQADDNHAVGSPAETNVQQLRANGDPVRPTLNGHTAEFLATGDAPHGPITGVHGINGHTVAAPAGNGHNVRPTTNGHTTDISPHPLPIDRHTASLAAEDHLGTHAADGSATASVVSGQEAPSSEPVASIDDRVSDVRTDGPMSRAADPEAAQSFPVAAEHAAISGARASAPGSGKPRLEPAQSAAAQQISLDDLHDGFGFDERSARTNTATSPHVNPHPSEHSIERAPRGDDAARHPGSTEATRTPPATTAGTAAQVHPNATAPRAAKRGKSTSAEQNDRSADAESEQLALEETPQPTHPRVEPMPILDADDEDDEFPTEPEEAATDDDEISAIARAITDRRLSALPIEEVREILTLADQGGSTPAIANELGVSRSAVTRVLDSALKVHRPYAAIG